MLQQTGQQSLKVGLHDDQVHKGISTIEAAMVRQTANRWAANSFKQAGSDDPHLLSQVSDRSPLARGKCDEIQLQQALPLVAVVFSGPSWEVCAVIQGDDYDGALYVLSVQPM